MAKSFLYGLALVWWWLCRRLLQSKNASHKMTSSWRTGPAFSSVSILAITAPPWCSLPTARPLANLRRITAVEVLSNHRLNNFLEIRRDGMKRLVQKLAQDSCNEFVKVEMKPRLSEMTYNTMMKMISGKRLKSLAKRSDGFLQGVIDEHRNSRQKANTISSKLQIIISAVKAIV
ncbi:cytochrome P450 81E8-like [Neltuma alba]|uniref:cytochrome P450 81E8-like n=1 Tax=Neltuma alba TaxID=207710 RepID=UPI0010A2F2AA|nr:cytochrome P450 81E8-like [Prosopis alba]